MPARLSEKKGFLLVAGILVPIACILFDPIVFQIGRLAAPVYGEPLLWRWQSFAYGAIFLSILTTGIYLLRPKLPPVILGVVGGAFAAASLVSLALGCYLLPTSLFGLFVIVGVFGLSPFLTSLAYFGSARRIYHDVLLVRSRGRAIVDFIIGAAAYGIAAGLFHICVDRGFADAFASAAEGRVAPLVAYSRAFGDFRLIQAYELERSEVRQRYLADAYRQLTGTDIDTRLGELND